MPRLNEENDGAEVRERRGGRRRKGISRASHSLAIDDGIGNAETESFFERKLDRPSLERFGSRNDGIRTESHVDARAISLRGIDAVRFAGLIRAGSLTAGAFDLGLLDLEGEVVVRTDAQDEPRADRARREARAESQPDDETGEAHEVDDSTSRTPECNPRFELPL